MTTQTVAGLFDTPEQARQAVVDLEGAGISHSDISLVASNADESWSSAGRDDDETDRASGAETGGTIGAVLGGGAGLLAGLGLLAIPGLGPVVAAGWLAATAVGAIAGGAAGGIIGSLTGEGISPEHAHVYAEGVKRGGSLVTARVDSNLAAEAHAILRRNGAVDPDVRRSDYQAAGWTGFDEAAPPYTRDELARDTTLTGDPSRRP
jgi:hypothetical protein